eukprot:4260007-Amphidinium_carterae.1
MLDLQIQHTERHDFILVCRQGVPPLGRVTSSEPLVDGACDNPHQGDSMAQTQENVLNNTI